MMDDRLASRAMSIVIPHVTYLKALIERTYQTIRQSGQMKRQENGIFIAFHDEKQFV
jgi:hypothetical protein